VCAFALSTCFALCALWPRTRSKAARGDRIDSLAAGKDLQQPELLLKMVKSPSKTNDCRNLFVRLASVAVAIALAGTMAQSMIFAFKAEPADAARGDAVGEREPDPVGLSSADEQRSLAKSCAPRVWLHSAELTGPMEPGSYNLSHGSDGTSTGQREGLRLRAPWSPRDLGRNCREARGGCYEFGGYLAYELTRPYAKHAMRPRSLPLRRGFALDVNNSARKGQSRQDPDAPVFFEFRRTPNKLLLTYWFFYGYSRPHVVEELAGRERVTGLLSHEGDWESVEVALSPDGSRPLALYLYGHGPHTRRLDASLLRGGVQSITLCLESPGHPIVFSALESHASYAEAGSTKVCGNLGCARDLRNEVGARRRGWPCGPSETSRGTGSAAHGGPLAQLAIRSDLSAREPGSFRPTSTRRTSSP
jgi:hypothetical protein